MTRAGSGSLLLLLALASAPGSGEAQGPLKSALGEVSFPTSGSPQAQAAFDRGLAALHSFWFEEALDRFRESTRIEPEFAMGYWGEAMAHNHPLWAEQDTEAARKVLAAVKEDPKLTRRERAYLDAVRALYGPGDKAARDAAYARAMERVQRDYPEDLEATAFFALSLLGTVRPGERGFARQMRAGALALDVYGKRPNHPGAAHYVIHAFDDPEHAILALPAARRYAEIAPEAHHARHMPAHIFLQLGMWPEAAASNESAWAASVAWVERKQLSLARRDYHSLSWLLYCYLQQGRYGKAEELIDRKRRDIAAAAGDAGVARGLAEMAAQFVFETRRWDRFDAAVAAPAPAAAPRSTAADASHAAHGADSSRADAVAVFTRGFAAAAAGRAPDAERAVAELRGMRAKLTATSEQYRAGVVEIRELEVLAVGAAARRAYGEAGERMKRATELEEAMSPPSGPPELVKPSHELYGEILLDAGRPQEAAVQFALALARQPNRARSLLGAARAAAAAGQVREAARFYGELLRFWEAADPNLPELDEARRALVSRASR